MRKSYKEIDSTYYESIDTTTIDEKIAYLENIIDQNQNVLSKNGNLISKFNKLTIVETIEAAQAEIKILNQIIVKENKEKI